MKGLNMKPEMFHEDKTHESYSTWPHLALLALLGLTWVNLAPLGSTGLHRAPLGSTGLHLAPQDSTWLHRAPLGSTWLHLAPLGSIWLHSAHIEPFRTVKSLTDILAHYGNRNHTPAYFSREVGQWDLASKGNKWLLRFAFTNLEWANNPADLLWKSNIIKFETNK